MRHTFHLPPFLGGPQSRCSIHPADKSNVSTRLIDRHSLLWKIRTDKGTDRHSNESRPGATLTEQGLAAPDAKMESDVWVALTDPDIYLTYSVIVTASDASQTWVLNNPPARFWYAKQWQLETRTDSPRAWKTTILTEGEGNKDRLVPLPATTLAVLRRFWQVHRHPGCCFPLVRVGRGRRLWPQRRWIAAGCS